MHDQVIATRTVKGNKSVTQWTNFEVFEGNFHVIFSTAILIKSSNRSTNTVQIYLACINLSGMNLAILMYVYIPK